MAGSGPTRERLAGVLNAAYGDGLLSQSTLVHRLDQLFGSDLVDPDRLTGDLTFRGAGRSLADVFIRARRSVALILRAERPGAERLLALDWSGARDELMIGRDEGCDVVLTGATVSRRHVRLCFRDGAWILHDLQSTNGTLVNHQRVIRCRLIAGDRLDLGSERLTVD
ncbi:MAG: FHA domain-containing protein [Actinomycetota bacterium]|nr:FHA domain-containing protein [Actinomycetota bacterium]